MPTTISQIIPDSSSFPSSHHLAFFPTKTTRIPRELSPLLFLTTDHTFELADWLEQRDFWSPHASGQALQESNILAFAIPHSILNDYMKVSLDEKLDKKA